MAVRFILTEYIASTPPIPLFSEADLYWLQTISNL
jgi:hypothetical protein